MLGDFLTGAAFGAALRASGVYDPAVIASQLNATNWHMIQSFLTGSGTSVCVFYPLLTYPERKIFQPSTCLPTYLAPGKKARV